MKKLYSYHTFLYPFSYEGLEDKCFASGSWEKEKLPKEIIQGAGLKDSDILLYNAYQYFFPKAKKNLFNDIVEDAEKTVSRHYQLKGVNDGNSWYIIKSETEEYRLVLKKISLSLYSEFKIGVLVFQTAYYPDKGRDGFTDVLKINQLGRRLFPPCINKKGNNLKSILTAEELCINDGSKYKIIFNREQYQMEPDMEFARNILGIQGQRDIQIKSILDDRMFVACLIRDDEIANMSVVKHLEEEMEPEQAKNVYEFVFVDGKGDCTCQSRRMLEKALRDHVYDRWVDYGTFYGITEYSLVCATGESSELDEKVVNPFLTIYVEIAKLALVQRAAITNIENQVLKEIVKEEIKGKEDRAHSEHIRDIWKQYVAFQNKLFLPEVTFQQQGVEIYQILKDALKIDVMNTHLERELDHLHNVAELDYQMLEREANDRIDYAINFVTVVGLMIALVSMAQGFLFGMKSIPEDPQYCSIGIGVCVSSILLLVFSVLLFWRKMKYRDDKAKGRGFIPGMLIIVIIVYVLLLLLVMA